MKILLFVLALMLVNVSAAEVPVLLYHNINETYAPHQADMNITEAMFEEHMKTLKNAGYNAVSIDAVVNDEELPENPVVITFDDGYYSNYEFGMPILEKYGMVGTVFVVTDKMGNFDTTYRHFGWDEAREMEESGIISIYSHTNSHSRFSTMSDMQIALEIRESKYIIEKELGKKCNILAAPYGDFDERTVRMLEKSGYDAVCRVGDIASDVSGEKIKSLKRYTVWGNMTGEDLLSLIN